LGVTAQDLAADPQAIESVHNCQGYFKISTVRRTLQALNLNASDFKCFF